MLRPRGGSVGPLSGRSPNTSRSAAALTSIFAVARATSNRADVGGGAAGAIPTVPRIDVPSTDALSADALTDDELRMGLTGVNAVIVLRFSAKSPNARVRAGP